MKKALLGFSLIIGTSSAMSLHSIDNEAGFGDYWDANNVMAITSPGVSVDNEAGFADYWSGPDVYQPTKYPIHSIDNEAGFGDYWRE